LGMVWLVPAWIDYYHPSYSLAGRNTALMAELYLQIVYDDDDFLKQEIVEAIEETMRDISKLRVPEVKEIESA